MIPLLSQKATPFGEGSFFTVGGFVFFRKPHRKKLQEKKQENPYFTLKYKEISGFPRFFHGVFFPTGSLWKLFSFGFRSAGVSCFAALRSDVDHANLRRPAAAAAASTDQQSLDGPKWLQAERRAVLGGP